MLRFLATALLLAAAPADAGPSDAQLALMETGLTQYSEVAGKVNACFPSEHGLIPEFAERIAELRYPSWWSGLTGARADYADSLQAQARLRFTVASMDVCDRITGAMFKNLMRQWERQLDSELRQ